jgi:type IV pilus assembly protein PilN
MTRINLLPWREELKNERKKQFAVMLGAAAAAGVLAWGVGHWHYQGLIEHQQYRNQVLQNEINEVEKRIAKIKDLEATKAKLVARMNVIQQLQQGRPQIVHFFDQLASTLPDGVYVTAVKQTASNVVINGIAESNARISSFMERLDASDWLTNPTLEVINVRAAARRRLSEYTLQVQQTGGPAAEPQVSERKGAKTASQGKS